MKLLGIFYIIITSSLTYFFTYFISASLFACKYDTVSYFGRTKDAITIAQIIGYWVGRFFGAWFLSSIKKKDRLLFGILTIFSSVIPYIFFGFLPPLGQVFMIFFTGIPLSCIWGFVIFYVEKRYAIEIIIMFIYMFLLSGSGISKTIAVIIMKYGVNENWIPLICGLFGAIMTSTFLMLLSKSPNEDFKIENKSVNQAMEDKSLNQEMNDVSVNQEMNNVSLNHNADDKSINQEMDDKSINQEMNDVSVNHNTNGRSINNEIPIIEDNSKFGKNIITIVSAVDNKLEEITDQSTFIKKYFIGLFLIGVTYGVLSGYKNYKDYYFVDILTDIYGNNFNPFIFSISEIIISIVVTIIYGCIIFIRNKFIAFFVILSIMLIGGILMMISITFNFIFNFDSIILIILLSIGSLMAYIPPGSLLFDKLLIVTNAKISSVFLIYLSEIYGPIINLILVLIKNIFFKDMSYVTYFKILSLVVSIFISIGMILIIISFIKTIKNIRLK
jgi:hypothetical protein